jgi:hypothetical protein
VADSDIRNFRFAIADLRLDKELNLIFQNSRVKNFSQYFVSETKAFAKQNPYPIANRKSQI